MGPATKRPSINSGQKLNKGGEQHSQVKDRVEMGNDSPTGPIQSDKSLTLATSQPAMETSVPHQCSNGEVRVCILYTTFILLAN